MSSTSPTVAPPRDPGPSPARRAVAVLLLVPVVVAAALWAFAWPGARTAPRDLPLGVAGPAAAAEPIARSLEQKEGAFEVHRYGDEAAARAAIEDRTVYGAVVATPDGPRLLTASAASPVVAALLREAVAPGGRPVPVTDVVAAPSGDPRGGVLAATALPLTFAGIASGALVTAFKLRRGPAAATLAGAAVLAAVTVTALAHDWLNVLTGSWWGEAGAVALTVFAVGAGTAGLAALAGPAGMALSSALMVLIGNPFSGAASAPELLPEPAGLIGQWLPPGAGSQLLRSQAYFDGNGSGGDVLVLCLWAGLGLAALLFARRRAGEGAPAVA
ncbi:ABC transporter permease [Streptomyces sp. NPDC020412]|uniref:ABC transporter permease n=1 Tax=Streptomyces sp. NPDC020412 TaxID=3365073 RepID=UPI0037A766BD